MLPVRNNDPERASVTPLPAPRASQPSIVPSSRPSAMPIGAIGSVMPGASMHVHSALLSAVAGYVDAAGFASLIGLFPAHLTGEIVGDAIAVSSGHLGEHATRLWMLPVFVCSVATATLVARLLRRRGRRALTGLLGLVTLGLALFSVSDLLARTMHESWHLRLLLGGGCAVAAMGFQNALMRESLTGSCPTTVMTGNLTHVVIELVEHALSKLMRPHKRDRKARARLLPVASALLAFIGFAVLGGLFTRWYGSLSVLLPTALTATLTYRAWHEDRKLLALSNLVSSLSPAALPSFEVWPESLLPRASSEHAPAGMPPTAPVMLAAGNSELRATPGERPPLKRTISGTQLSSRFRRED